MNKTIDMQFMRYINLFRSYTKISTSDCFNYNNTIYFAVPKSQMSLALGRNGENIKRLVEVLRKKIRVIPAPNQEIMASSEMTNEKRKQIFDFIKEIVSPVELEKIDIVDNNVVVSGTRESKAIIIGRDRSKEKELAEILTRTIGISGFKVL